MLMNTKKWIGLTVHLLLGALFPYVFVGCVILIYGFMSPPTSSQKLWGIVIALAYVAILFMVNFIALRSLGTKKDKWYRLALHGIVFVLACAVSFMVLRFY